MLPKTITHLHLLKEFDRFCFLKDKAKKVYQVVEHFIIEFNGERKRMTRCINDNLEKKKFDGNRVVIYLRSNNPKITRRVIKPNPQLIDY